MQIWTGEHSAAMWLEQSKTIFRLTHVEWKQGPQGTSDFLAFYEIFVKRAPLSVMLPRQFDYIIQPPCRLAAYARHLASWLSFSPLYTKWYYFVQNVVKAFNAFVTSYSYIYTHIFIYKCMYIILVLVARDVAERASAGSSSTKWVTGAVLCPWVLCV